MSKILIFFIVIVLEIAISGCQQMGSIENNNTIEILEVEKVKNDPSRYYGKLISVQGYLGPDSLIEEYLGKCSGNPKHSKDLVVLYHLSKKKFDKYIGRWVTIKGKFEYRERLVLGGGDIAIALNSNSDFVGVIDHPKIVSVNYDRVCKH